MHGCNSSTRIFALVQMWRAQSRRVYADGRTLTARRPRRVWGWADGGQTARVGTDGGLSPKFALKSSMVMFMSSCVSRYPRSASMAWMVRRTRHSVDSSAGTHRETQNEERRDDDGDELVHSLVTQSGAEAGPHDVPLHCALAVCFSSDRDCRRKPFVRVECVWMRGGVRRRARGGGRAAERASAIRCSGGAVGSR